MLRVTEVTPIGQLTGENSVNQTGSRFGVYGTDLGIIWDNGRGEVLVAFGDSYGERWGGNGAGPADADWRCNVLARSRTTDLAEGMRLHSVVSRPDGSAAQILDRDGGQPREETIIPTSGIAVGERNYLHYMSVREWGPPGHWQTNYSGIAVSEDDGRTWSKPDSARWPNTASRVGWWRRPRAHPFQLGAFARSAQHVYLLGTPHGRFGDVSAARVDPDRVLDVSAYQYWTGKAWQDGDPFLATPVMSGPVGELSVQYQQFFGRWIAVHLDEGRAAIVLREAPEPTGPWSGGTVLASAADHPAPYGGFLHPWALDGPEIYFTLSRWGPYNVTLMRASLAAD